MSRYVRALRDLGVNDARAIEALAPHIESLYTASAKLHRALAPYGGTAHAVLSRASAPDHDPDADEVYWVTIFDKLGLFNMSDRYTSRMIDALFRYIWRHHEADMFVTQLAAMRPGTSASQAPVDDDGRGGPFPPQRPTAPSVSTWISSLTPPATVRPTDRHLAPIRDLITAIDKVANPAVLARKVATCALLALYTHVSTTHYSTATVEEIGEDGEEPTIALSATGHRSGAAGSSCKGNDAASGVAAAADAMQVVDGQAVNNTGDGGTAAADAAAVDYCEAVNHTDDGGAAAAAVMAVDCGEVVNKTGDVGGSAADGSAAAAINVDGGKAVHDTGDGDATAADAAAFDDGKAVNHTRDGGAAAANAAALEDGEVVDHTASGGTAAADAIQVIDGNAVNHTADGGTAAAHAAAVDDGKAVNQKGDRGAATADAAAGDGGEAVNNAASGCVAAADAIPIVDGNAVKTTGDGGPAAADAAAGDGGEAVDSAASGGAAAVDAMQVDQSKAVNTVGDGDAGLVDHTLTKAAHEAARLFVAANENNPLSLSPRHSTSKDGQSKGPSTATAAQQLEGGPPTSERKMKYLTSHFKCTWWPSHRSDTKAAAPRGTIANLLGDATVLTRRSSWAFHVDLLGLKECLEATSFGRSPVFKISEIEKSAVVVSLTNMARRPLLGVFAVLLLVSFHEPTFPGLLKEIVGGEMSGVMDPGLFPIVGGVVQVGRGVRRDHVNLDVPDGGAGAAEQDGGLSVRAPAAASGASTSEVLERHGIARDSADDDLRLPASSTPGDADAAEGAGRSSALSSSPASPPFLNPNPSTTSFVPAPVPPNAHHRSGRVPSESAGRGRGGHGCGRGRGRGGHFGLGSEFLSSGSTAVDAAYLFQALPPTALARRNRLARRRVAKAKRAGKSAAAALGAAAAGSTARPPAAAPGGVRRTTAASAAAAGSTARPAAAAAGSMGRTAATAAASTAAALAAGAGATAASAAVAPLAPASIPRPAAASGEGATTAAVTAPRRAPTACVGAAAVVAVAAAALEAARAPMPATAIGVGVATVAAAPK